MIKKVLFTVVIFLSTQSCAISDLTKQKGFGLFNKHSFADSKESTIGYFVRIPISSPPKNLSIKEENLKVHISTNSVQVKQISSMVSIFVPLPPILYVGAFSEWEEDCKENDLEINLNFERDLKRQNDKDEFLVKSKEIYLITKNNKILQATSLPRNNYRGPREKNKITSKSDKESSKLFDNNFYKDADYVGLKINIPCKELEGSKLFINGIYKNNKRIEIEPANFIYKEGYVLTFIWA